MKEASGELETTKVNDPEATPQTYGTTEIPSSPTRVSPLDNGLAVPEVRYLQV